MKTDTEPLGWSMDAAGNVVLCMTRDDYDSLLLLLGAGTSELYDNKVMPLSRSLALVNRLNAGNPHYRPYQIPETNHGSHSR